MRTITGLFDAYDDASSAVRSLKDAGIPSDDISIVANNSDGSYSSDHDRDNDVTESADDGAGIGAVVGGAGGLLAGLGALTIPGVGPVVAGGWLLAAAIGAVTGAAVGGATGGIIIGALKDAGVEERDAHLYAEGVRRGGALVTARVHDSRADAAHAILRDASGVDIDSRRRQYEDEGWKSFDESADPYSPDQVRDYRLTIVPPMIR